MSIANEITRLQGAKSTLKTKLNAKNDEQHQITNETIDEYGDFVDSIQSSNIIGATAEGENLSLTNTKAMPYSDYVVEGKSEQDGEPSPSNPSEIHSVADDVNLFDIENTTSITNGTIEDNVITSNTININSFNLSCYNNLKLKAGTYYISVDIKILSGTATYNKLNDGISDGTVIVSPTLNNEFQRYIISKTYTSETNISRLMFQFNGTNAVIQIKNIKISTKNTPYSPYNQGTVKIKQRGKNLFNTSNIISSVTDYTITVQDGGFIIRTGGMSNGGNLGLLKDLCPNLKVGNKFKFNWDTNATRNNSDVNYIYLGSYANTIRKDITYTCTQEMLDSETFFYGQQGQYYKNIIFYLEGQTSDYEPYQGYDKVFQTEPLRSLPNGVKDTIEAEQHRKIGKQTGTLTETTTITLSDAKTNGAYMCNIKPSGTLTGKTIELEAGDYEIIYELEEETIEPLTQNQATTMLDIIKTGSYEGTTNIYTDEDVKPTIEVEYYKYGETGGLPTVENEKLIFDKELQIDREELIF